MIPPSIRRLCASLLFPAALIAGAGSSSEAAVFNPETFTLKNGMQVVVITNRRAPVVTHHVWYRIGSSDSPPGKSGLAHFHEHLMFKATDELASGDFSKEVARNGGNDNAFTGPDYTGYFQTIARDRLELVMKMEADRMTNLVLAEDEVLRERDVVLEERSMRVDNNPSARFAEQINAAQFLHHPYRMPVIGWRHEIEAYTREDSLDFYRTWYAPNNAILLVAGDIDAEELKPLAEKYYGVIPARQIPKRVRVQDPPQGAARTVTLTDPRVRQPSWMRSYLAPSFSSGATEHAYPLTVLAEILGGTSTSRLYRSLVIDQQIATSAGSYYRGSALDLATFRLYGSPKPGVKLDELEAAVDAELARLIDEPITADEVSRATKRLVAEAVYARDSMSGAVRSFGIALTTGRTVEDVEAWPERIAAVTAEDIAAAIEAVIAPERSVTGRLLPADLPETSATQRAAVSQ
ncbi:MAG: pitrilysin family protein [Alphaproteobacteria bacterium]